MAGLRVVVVACDRRGNVDLADLAPRPRSTPTDLAALMITYPRTHGVFEERRSARSAASSTTHGGQVYMDGANMNAQVGLTSPARIGADVCHLNLHKTFCIPHGGGGPGVGPDRRRRPSGSVICPTTRCAPMPARPPAIGPVAAAPFGSALILPISYAYIRMMGADGPEARPPRSRSSTPTTSPPGSRPHYPVLYTGAHGMVAHECIIDCRGFAAEPA